MSKYLNEIKYFIQNKMWQMALVSYGQALTHMSCCYWKPLDTSGGVRELVIRVHSGVKTEKKIFLGVAHMVKNYTYTKKMKFTRVMCTPRVNLDPPLLDTCLAYWGRLRAAEEKNTHEASPSTVIKKEDDEATYSDDD
jgi:hypothetical protein